MAKKKPTSTSGVVKVINENGSIVMEVKGKVVLGKKYELK